MFIGLYQRLHSIDMCTCGLIIYPHCQSVMVNNVIKVCSTSMQGRTWMDERETIQSTIDLLNRHVKC